MYLVGVPAFAAITGTPIGAALLGATVFLPGDIAKVVVTVLREGRASRVARAHHPEAVAAAPEHGGANRRMSDWLHDSSDRIALAFGGDAVRYGELACAVLPQAG